MKKIIIAILAILSIALILGVFTGGFKKIKDSLNDETTKATIEESSEPTVSEPVGPQVQGEYYLVRFGKSEDFEAFVNFTDLGSGNNYSVLRVENNEGDMFLYFGSEGPDGIMYEDPNPACVGVNTQMSFNLDFGETPQSCSQELLDWLNNCVIS